MKKGFVLGLILLLAFLVFSCGSGPAAVSDPNMPPWMNETAPEDMLWGIGVSSNATVSMRMTMADAGARQDLARQLQTLARGMVTSYEREAGGINNTAAMQFGETITRQLAQATLQGAVRDQTWTTADGKTLWMRVRMSKADAANTISGEVLKAVDSEAARYAEFKTMDALKMMDSEFEKNPQSPQPVIQ